MTEKSSNETAKKIIEDYYKLIGEAHVNNLINELDEKKEEIANVKISDRMNDWFRDFAESERKKEKRNIRIRRFKRISGKTVIAASILFALTISLSFTVEAVRVKVLNFLINTYEKFTEIIVNDKTELPPKDIDWEDEYYYPSYLPDGYEYKSSVENGSIKTILFVNSDNVELRFNQVRNGTKIQLDTEDSVVTKITIDGKEGMVIKKSDRVIIFWYSDKTSLTLIGYADSKEMIRIAESIIQR
jgi:hypothetical protein